MPTVLHVVVDASAGMRAAGKLRLCLAAVSAIRRCGREAYGLYSQMPSVQVWRFAAEVTTPFRPRLPAAGTASLTSLSSWFNEVLPKITSEKPTPVLLFSDGLFEDFTTLNRLGIWLRDSQDLRIAVVGVGPDRDMETLAELSSSGRVWKLGELDCALRELLGHPPDEGCIQESLHPFLCEPDDEEIV